MSAIIKVFRGELIKLSLFMFCFTCSILYLMNETNTDFEGVFNYLIKTIIF